MSDGENQYSFQGIYLLIKNQVITAIENISGVGGGGGGGVDESGVQSAIEAATNLDQIEGYIDTLEASVGEVERFLTTRQYTASPANLTAPGNTAALDVSATTGELVWIITFDLSAIDTNVVMQAGGVIDSQNVVLGPPITITDNGSHAIQGPNTPTDSIFLTFVSEDGGTNATVSNIKLRARGRGI